MGKVQRGRTSGGGRTCGRHRRRRHPREGGDPVRPPSADCRKPWIPAFAGMTNLTSAYRSRRSCPIREVLIVRLRPAAEGLVDGEHGQLGELLRVLRLPLLRYGRPVEVLADDVLAFLGVQVFQVLLGHRTRAAPCDCLMDTSWAVFAFQCLAKAWLNWTYSSRVGSYDTLSRVTGCCCAKAPRPVPARTVPARPPGES